MKNTISIYEDDIWCDVPKEHQTISFLEDLKFVSIQEDNHAGIHELKLLDKE